MSDFDRLLDKILSDPRITSYEFRCGSYMENVFICVKNIEFLYNNFLNNSDYFGIFCCSRGALIEIRYYEKVNEKYVLNDVVSYNAPMIVDGESIDNSTSKEHIKIFNITRGTQISFTLYKKNC